MSGDKETIAMEADVEIGINAILKPNQTPEELQASLEKFIGLQLHGVNLEAIHVSQGVEYQVPGISREQLAHITAQTRKNMEEYTQAAIEGYESYSSSGTEEDLKITRTAQTNAHMLKEMLKFLEAINLVPLANNQKFRSDYIAIARDSAHALRLMDERSSEYIKGLREYVAGFSNVYEAYEVMRRNINTPKEIPHTLLHYGEDDKGKEQTSYEKIKIETYKVDLQTRNKNKEGIATTNRIANAISPETLKKIQDKRQAALNIYTSNTKQIEKAYDTVRGDISTASNDNFNFPAVLQALKGNIKSENARLLAAQAKNDEDGIAKSLEEIARLERLRTEVNNQKSKENGNSLAKSSAQFTESSRDWEKIFSIFVPVGYSNNRLTKTQVAFASSALSKAVSSATNAYNNAPERSEEEKKTYGEMMRLIRLKDEFSKVAEHPTYARDKELLEKNKDISYEDLENRSDSQRKTIKKAVTKAFNSVYAIASKGISHNFTDYKEAELLARAAEENLTRVIDREKAEKEFKGSVGKVKSLLGDTAEDAHVKSNKNSGYLTRVKSNLEDAITKKQAIEKHRPLSSVEEEQFTEIDRLVSIYTDGLPLHRRNLKQEEIDKAIELVKKGVDKEKLKKLPADKQTEVITTLQNAVKLITAEHKGTPSDDVLSAAVVSAEGVSKNIKVFKKDKEDEVKKAEDAQKGADDLAKVQAFIDSNSVKTIEDINALGSKHSLTTLARDITRNLRLLDTPNVALVEGQETKEAREGLTNLSKLLTDRVQLNQEAKQGKKRADTRAFLESTKDTTSYELAAIKTANPKEYHRVVRKINEATKTFGVEDSSLSEEDKGFATIAEELFNKNAAVSKLISDKQTRDNQYDARWKIVDAANKIIHKYSNITAASFDDKTAAEQIVIAGALRSALNALHTESLGAYKGSQVHENFSTAVALVNEITKAEGFRKAAKNARDKETKEEKLENAVAYTEANKNLTQEQVENPLHPLFDKAHKLTEVNQHAKVLTEQIASKNASPEEVLAAENLAKIKDIVSASRTQSQIADAIAGKIHVEKSLGSASDFLDKHKETDSEKLLLVSPAQLKSFSKALASYLKVVDKAEKLGIDVAPVKAGLKALDAAYVNRAAVKKQVEKEDEYKWAEMFASDNQRLTAEQFYALASAEKDSFLKNLNKLGRIATSDGTVEMKDQYAAIFATIKESVPQYKKGTTDEERLREAKEFIFTVVGSKGVTQTDREEHYKGIAKSSPDYFKVHAKGLQKAFDEVMVHLTGKYGGKGIHSKDVDEADLALHYNSVKAKGIIDYAKTAAEYEIDQKSLKAERFREWQNTHLPALRKYAEYGTAQFEAMDRRELEAAKRSLAAAAEFATKDSYNNYNVVGYHPRTEVEESGYIEREGIKNVYQPLSPGGLRRRADALNTSAKEARFQEDIQKESEAKERITKFLEEHKKTTSKSIGKKFPDPASRGDFSDTLKGVYNDLQYISNEEEKASLSAGLKGIKDLLANSPATKKTSVTDEDNRKKASSAKEARQALQEAITFFDAHRDITPKQFLAKDASSQNDFKKKFNKHAALIYKAAEKDPLLEAAASQADKVYNATSRLAEYKAKEAKDAEESFKASKIARALGLAEEHASQKTEDYAKITSPTALGDKRTELNAARKLLSAELGKLSGNTPEELERAAVLKQAKDDLVRAVDAISRVNKHRTTEKKHTAYSESVATVGNNVAKLHDIVAGGVNKYLKLSPEDQKDVESLIKETRTALGKFTGYKARKAYEKEMPKGEYEALLEAFKAASGGASGIINLANKQVKGVSRTAQIGESYIANAGGIDNLQNIDKSEHTAVRAALRERLYSLQERINITSASAADPARSAEDVSRLRSELDSMQASAHQTREAINNLGGGMRGFSSLAREATEAAKQFAKYTLIYGTGYKLISAASSLFGGGLDLDRILHAIKAISGATNKAMVVIEESIKHVAETSEFSTSQIGSAAQVLAQAGIEPDKIPTILMTTSKLASATGSSMETSAQVLTSLSDVFDKTSSVEIDQLANKVAQSVNLSKLSADSLKTIVSLTASTAKASGVSEDQLLGYSATLSNKGVKDSTIATGLREAMLELFSPDARTISFLKSRYAAAGDIKITDSAVRAKFQNFKEADDPIRAALNELRKLGVAGVAKNDFDRVTESRAQNVILPLLESLDKASLNVAAIGQGGVLDAGAATQMAAVTNAANGMWSALTSLTHELSQNFYPSIVSTFNGLRDFSEWLRKKYGEANSNNPGGQGWDFVASMAAGSASGWLAGLVTKNPWIKTVASLAGGGVFSVTQANNEAEGNNTTHDVLNLAAISAGFYQAFSWIKKSIPLGTPAVAHPLAVAAAAAAEAEVSAEIATGLSAVVRAAFLRLLTTRVGQIALALGSAFLTQEVLKRVSTDPAESPVSTRFNEQEVANARTRQEEENAMFYSYDPENKDSKPTRIDDATRKLSEGSVKLADLLPANTTVTEPIVKEVLALVQLAPELGVGGVLKAEIVKNLEGAANTTFKPGEVDQIAEVGAGIKEQLGVLSASREQQQLFLRSAWDAPEGSRTASQKASMVAWEKLAPERKKLLSGVEEVSYANYEIMSQVLKEFFGLVNDAPREEDKAVTDALLNLAKESVKPEVLSSKGGSVALEKLLGELSGKVRDKVDDPLIEQITTLHAQLVSAREGAANERASDGYRKKDTELDRDAKLINDGVYEKFIGEVEDIKQVAIKKKSLQDSNKEEDKKKKEVDTKQVRAMHEEDRVASSKIEDADNALLRFEKENVEKGKKAEADLNKANVNRDLEGQEKAQKELSALKKERDDLELAKVVYAVERYVLDPALTPYASRDNPKVGAGELFAMRNSDKSIEEKARFYLDNPTLNQSARKDGLEILKDLATRAAQVGIGPREESIKIEGIQRAKDTQHNATATKIQKNDRGTFDFVVSEQKKNGTFVSSKEKNIATLNKLYDDELAIAKSQMELDHIPPEDRVATITSMAQARKKEIDAFIAEVDKAALTAAGRSLERQLKAAEESVHNAVSAGNTKDLPELQESVQRIKDQLNVVEVKKAEKEGQLTDEKDINGEQPKGTSSKQDYIDTLEKNDENTRFSNTLEANKNAEEFQARKYEREKADSPFSPREEGYRKGAEKLSTREQRVATLATNATLTVDRLSELKTRLGDYQSNLDLAKEAGNVGQEIAYRNAVEDTKHSIEEAKKALGEFDGELRILTASFGEALSDVSLEGVLSEFQKLNPGFTQLRQQIESNTAQMLDGVSGVIGDFITSGFDATKNLEAVRGAMQNTSQAMQNYDQVVAGRIGLLSAIQSSSSLVKESPAVQAMIINQAAAAQLGAEQAAKDQLAAAKREEEIVRNENSLGGQLSKVFGDSAKNLASTMVKDTIGEGISNLLGISTGKDTYTAGGSLNVNVTNGTDIGGVLGAEVAGSQSGSSTFSGLLGGLKNLGGIGDKIDSIWTNLTGHSTGVSLSGMFDSAYSSIGGLFSSIPSGTPALSGSAFTEAAMSNGAFTAGGYSSAVQSPFSFSASEVFPSSSISGAAEASLSSNLGNSSISVLEASNSATQAGGSAAGLSNMAAAGAVFSMGMSAYSIYNTVDAYSDSVDYYEEVLREATKNNYKAPEVFAADTTSSASSSVDTGYSAITNPAGALAGYINSPKYKDSVTNSLAPAAMEGIQSRMKSPASYSSTPQTGAAEALSTGVQQLAGVINSTQREAAKQQNVRVVNVVDPSLVHDFMSSASGEKVLLNTIQRNSASIKNSLR